MVNSVGNLTAAMSTSDISSVVFGANDRTLFCLSEARSGSDLILGFFLSLVSPLLDFYNVGLHHMWSPSETAWPGFDF